MITPEQIKAARKLLGWSQMTLALESNLAQTTIGSIETGKKSPSTVTLGTIQSAFEKAGVEFPEGKLPRLRSAHPLRGRA
jgi:transcriptional regulator with XRE-family HTH domain